MNDGAGGIEEIASLEGKDRFNGWAGDDQVFGVDGTDIARHSSSKSHYTINVYSGVTTVVDTIIFRDASDIVYHIERLGLSDRSGPTPERPISTLRCGCWYRDEAMRRSAR